MTVKFLLVNFENQGVTSLVRESDGMMLASVQANRCAMLQDGDPNLQPEMRLFLDNEHAIRYLKESVAWRVARKDNEPRDGWAPDRDDPITLEFETREGDSRILTPNQMGGGLGRPH